MVEGVCVWEHAAPGLSFSIGEVFLNLSPRSVLVSVLDAFQKPQWNSMAAPLLCLPSLQPFVSLRN